MEPTDTLNVEENPTEPTREAPVPAAIRMGIVGVGGAGLNLLSALNTDLPCWAVDTDARAFQNAPQLRPVWVGHSLTRGLSTGGELDLGRQCALKDKSLLEEVLRGLDGVILITGLGGGTGSGAAPIVAELAAAQGAFVLVFATLPFPFEGKRRAEQADLSLLALRKTADAVIPLPNTLLLQQLPESTPLSEAFVFSAQWVAECIRAFTDLLYRPSLIHLDFAHLRQVFKSHGGRSLFGFARTEGPDCFDQLLPQLKLCPFLHLPELNQKAHRLLIHLTVGTQTGLDALSQAMTQLNGVFASTEETLWSVCLNPDWGARVQALLLGTTELAGHHGVRQATWGTQGSSKKKVAQTAKSAFNQTEFQFMPDANQKGFFQKTEKNTYQGQDLDVPSYLRMGVRIRI